MKSFAKQSSCPTTEEILFSVTGSIGLVTRLGVEQHARSCDFCGAEMQLLAKFSLEETHRPTPAAAQLVPRRMKALAAGAAAVSHARAA
jgi:hypothetical protein